MSKKYMKFKQSKADLWLVLVPLVVKKCDNAVISLFILIVS